MKIKLLVELNYNSNLMHGKDPEGIKWFYKNVFMNKPELLLHSNYIGDTIGKIKVLKIFKK